MACGVWSGRTTLVMGQADCVECLTVARRAGKMADACGCGDAGAHMGPARDQVKDHIRRERTERT